jgi:hypothetical protein
MMKIVTQKMLVAQELGGDCPGRALILERVILELATHAVALIPRV